MAALITTLLDIVIEPLYIFIIEDLGIFYLRYKRTTISISPLRYVVLEGVIGYLSIL